MKAWHVHNLDSIELKESVLERKGGEVKLKVARFAISADDVDFFLNNQDSITVPAHSAVGIVSEADKEFGMPLGTKVAVSPFVEKEDGTIDVMGIDMNGFAQDFVCVPNDNVFQVPSDIPDEQLIFADYIAMADKSYGAVDFEKGDYVVIVGADTLGLILAQLALYYQAIPIIVDYDVDKLRMATQWGVYYTLNPTEDNLDEKVRELTGGRLCDFALYSSKKISLDIATRLIKEEGEIIIVGFANQTIDKVDMTTVLKKQLKIVGISNGDGSFSTAINMLANKIVKTDGLVGKHYNFEDFEEVFKYIHDYPLQYNKVVIDIQKL